MSGRTAAVTGGSGFVGRYVVRELLDRGWHVRALVRDLDKGSDALPVGHERLTLVVGDALKSASLDELVEGCDTAVNTVGIIREAPGGQTFKHIHVELVKRFVGACERAGVGRFVQISALGVAPEAPTAYWRTKWLGEQAVRKSSLRWTILRPGMIHGAESGFLKMAKGWVCGRSAPFVFIPYFTRRADGRHTLAPGKTADPLVQPVAVEDVAWAVGESLERPEAVGEVYTLTGPETMTMPEMLIRIRDAVPLAKKKLKPVGIPGPLAEAKARGAAVVGMKYALPFDAGMARMGSTDSTGDSAKASAQLGFEARAFGPMLERYAARI